MDSPATILMAVCPLRSPGAAMRQPILPAADLNGQRQTILDNQTFLQRYIQKRRNDNAARTVELEDEIDRAYADLKTVQAEIAADESEIQKYKDFVGQPSGIFTGPLPDE